MSESDCIFCKMVRGEIQPAVVYRDDQVLAFRDINPQAPVHVLVIPNEHISSLAELGEGHQGLAGHLLLAARQVAIREGVGDGFRLVVNVGAAAGMSVGHLHVHVLGGRSLAWPPG